ncbi:hypothetical protein BY996DRAFT_6489288 [Phakopsora pachyrhizi]|nr:hypothetical protein BY996DRAFT_6489288 [Phakopsora pachyrhizi]
MDKLMCADPMKLLGANGAAENKASFVPSVTDPESTNYFDLIGVTQVFHDDDNPPPLPNMATTTTTLIGPTVPTNSSNSWSELSSRPHQMLNHVHGRRPSKKFSRIFGQNTLDDPTPRNTMPSRALPPHLAHITSAAAFSISELEKLPKVELETPHILAVLTARKKVENKMNKMLMEGLVLLDQTLLASSFQTAYERLHAQLTAIC